LRQHVGVNQGEQMKKQFEEVELVYKIHLVARSDVANNLIKYSKSYLDEALAKIPHCLLGESVVEVKQINSKEEVK
jgi:hypothetical protein